MYPNFIFFRNNDGVCCEVFFSVSFLFLNRVKVLLCVLYNFGVVKFY